MRDPIRDPQPLDPEDVTALIRAAQAARDLLRTRPQELDLRGGSDAAFVYRALRDALKAVNS